MADFLKTIGNALRATQAASQNINNGISELRRHIQDIKRERSKVVDLPISKEETLERVDAMIDHLTRDARYFYPDPKDISRPGFSANNISAISILIAQRASDMAEKMKRDVEDFYASAVGITSDERENRLRDIDRKILDAELAEESLIRAAENSGFPILRRRDADPRAVLAHDKVLP
ncbi:conserved hypothetical protein [Agrobacterium deltaense Zutra 3/1]|uniref:Uncharacterized protein n=1 Tax=Agrobacterium deltaense Zutra 3/1 TaxID=1183427 RepID=A0A1S7PMH3_9HYPH|nr:hypothetical protein [Agrobacterium deltaense]CUX23206.1 conserved hypothetical protein [Agrobacterium deltaense Zutra 3/1]